ncbi:hypothetical protein C8R47DRAFT_1205069 [Mycena vitilis]|nr:hypothetical protein C8R47DRAFT_1205069 [Mycena vitilis]
MLDLDPYVRMVFPLSRALFGTCRTPSTRSPAARPHGLSCKILRARLWSPYVRLKLREKVSQIYRKMGLRFVHCRERSVCLVQRVPSPDPRPLRLRGGRSRSTRTRATGPTPVAYDRVVRRPASIQARGRRALRTIRRTLAQKSLPSIALAPAASQYTVNGYKRKPASMPIPASMHVPIAPEDLVRRRGSAGIPARPHGRVRPVAALGLPWEGLEAQLCVMRPLSSSGKPR